MYIYIYPRLDVLQAQTARWRNNHVEYNGKRGGCAHAMRGRGRVTLAACVPIITGRGTSDFHRPGQTLREARAKRRNVLGRTA